MNLLQQDAVVQPHQKLNLVYPLAKQLCFLPSAPCREKNSAKAERLVQFTGSSQICGLPPYLTVQMMRFFFKRTPDGGQKAKILRKVC
jgi:hypothetical protein